MYKFDFRVKRFVLKNSIFRDFTSTAITDTGGLGVSAGDIYNNIFHNNNIAIRTNNRMNIANNLFTGNTSDFVDLGGGGANPGDLQFCGFGTEPGPYGGGNIFGVTAANLYKSAAANDFRVNNALSASVETGTVLPGVGLACSPRPR